MAANDEAADILKNGTLVSVRGTEFHRAKIVEFRGDFSNIFNHAQYTAGLINSVNRTSQTTTRVFLQASNPNFQQWSTNFSSRRVFT